MTPIEFANCIATLENGIDRKMPAPQANVWYTVLKDLTVDQLQQAIVRALCEHKFAGFPPVGLLRDFAGCKPTAAIPASDRAVIAWDAVIRAVRDEGAYRTVQFDDPAATAAVRSVGGWTYLCDLPSEELFQYTKPRFLEAYRAYCHAGVQAIAAEPLPGILATDAGRDGYELPPVIEVETGLPSDVKVIGEPRPPRIESDQVKRLTAALPDVETSDLLDLTDITTELRPSKPLEECVIGDAEIENANAQKAALAAKFGL